MRSRTFALLLLAATTLIPAAHASSAGDSYDQVIKDNGPPASVLSGGPVQILVYPKFSIKLRDGVVVAVKAAVPNPAPGAPPSAVTAPAPARGDFVPPDPKLTPAEQWGALDRQRTAALTQVVQIVNQEVEGVPVERGMHLGHWDNAWFHPGAITPDFLTVDVRQSQELAHYDKYEYVTSNLHPGVAYRGAQCEFNSMTKLFYKDRSVPKKRLDESEMLEVNRLYRVIGKCNAAMQALGQPAPPILPTG